MAINLNELKRVEDVFDAKCGALDTKHITNLSRNEVPQAVLDKVEAGCPLEVIDELARDFPICKYATQITIHGHFPATSTRRIGAYVNLVRNKNESIGVRWNAIDYKKKSRLFSLVRKCKTGYHAVYNSQGYRLEKYEQITAANAAELIAKYKADAARIDKSLFFGGVEVYTGSVFGMTFIVMVVGINAFYEKNFDALAQNLTGLDAAGIEAAVAAYDAEQAAFRAEQEAKAAAWKAECEREEREIAEKNAAWVAANAAPFPLRENHTLRKGDIIALPVTDGSWRSRLYASWQCYVIGSAFGKLTKTPCDAAGVVAKTQWGSKARGVAIDARRATGAYYVKAA